MRKVTPSMESSVGLSRRLFPVNAITASVIFTGCSSASAEADVSDEGQIAYACALTEHVLTEHDASASWEVVVGDEANPAARETAAIGALTTTSDHVDLADIGAKLTEGLARVDLELLAADLEDIRKTCDSLEISQKPDVSHAGQLDYACALANRVADQHGSATAWIEQSEPDAWYELASATALTGAFNGQTLAEEPELSEAGIQLFRALQLNDTDAIDASQDTFQSTCIDL